MSAQARRLLDGALRLPIPERATLAVELFASLDGDPDPDADEMWAAEIQRRTDDVGRGSVKLVPGEAVMKRLRARTGRVRHSK